MLLSLTGICLVAGAILAGVNQFTAGPIAVAKATALEEAIKAVAPEFDNKPTEDVYMAVSSDGDSLKIYPAKKGGQVVGGAVESNTKKGFSGEIRGYRRFRYGWQDLELFRIATRRDSGLGSQDARMVPCGQEQAKCLGTYDSGRRLKSNKRWWRCGRYHGSDNLQPCVPRCREPCV